MKLENIEVKGKKVSPEKVEKAINYMIKELGEDGLCHLVTAYQESSTIKTLVKGEISTRKVAGKAKKALAGGAKMATGLMSKIRNQA